MDYHIIRYQERDTKKTKFVQVIAKDDESALGVFRRLVTDYIDETPIVISREDYREIRENLGLNPDGIDDSELTPQMKKFLEISRSKEWRDYYASGGYEDF
jgi:hypothetical protein